MRRKAHGGSHCFWCPNFWSAPTAHWRSATMSCARRSSTSSASTPVPPGVMSFGEKEGAIGYLVGRENEGLPHMFTMMNEARQKVGLQGLGIAERAYQAARDYAQDRVQGRPAGQRSGDRVTIIHHPDVRRMLLTMKSQIEAMRAFGYVLAADVDWAHRHPDEAERRRRQARVELLTPVLKGWCTELGIEIASMGVQVHGGMGFIEET